jgi:hypothetical protein
MGEPGVVEGAGGVGGVTVTVVAAAGCGWTFPQPPSNAELKRVARQRVKGRSKATPEGGK